MWCRVVWCHVVWCGVVSRGVVWYGVTLRGVVSRGVGGAVCCALPQAIQMLREAGEQIGDFDDFSCVFFFFAFCILLLFLHFFLLFVCFFGVRTAPLRIRHPTSPFPSLSSFRCVLHLLFFPALF